MRNKIFKMGLLFLLFVPADVNPKQIQVFDQRDYEIEMLLREINQKRLQVDILMKEIAYNIP